MKFDLLIKGGKVLDGSGSDPITADIGVNGDRIAAIGALGAATAENILNAENLHVSPGFIDIHTHSDISALYHPEQSSSVAMGVTTQVVGNCGLSPGFAIPADIFAFEQRWVAPYGVRFDWKDFGGYLNRIEEQGIANNFLPLAGHNTLRKRVMGMAKRAPDKEESLAMQNLLQEALQSGVWGFSSGLEYIPSGYAKIEEMITLCRMVKDAGGFYATHLRNEGDTLIESVQEAITTAEGAGIPLQLSHHKAEGKPNWGKINITLDIVQKARERGLDVQMDQYPYTAFMTSLYVQILPEHAQGGTNEEMAERLRNSQYRSRLLTEMFSLHPHWRETSEWERIRIAVCRGRVEIQGKSLASLGKEAGIHPAEYALQLLADTNGYVSAVNFAISEEDIAQVMRFPYTSIGSDGVATQPEGKMAEDQVHPRTYGTFTRVLGRYVRELGILTEAEAIHKMTGLPAARLNLPDRGLLLPGSFADITLYSPELARDIATFEKPHQYSQGIAAVIVNGRIAFQNGTFTNARAGKVLRRQGA